MTYYHCSPVSGLTELVPGKPRSFDKPARVYMTTMLPMAMMYGIRNYEYTYGYTKEKEIYLEEYFPDALELYRGKSASLYICAPTQTEQTQIPNEAVCETTVPVVQEIPVPDVLEALLEQERLGNLRIIRYRELSQRKLDWIRKVQADIIREKGLTETTGEMADYYRTHYPESWRIAETESASG